MNIIENIILRHICPSQLLYATIVGSHAFGYALPTSDLDVRGVHLLSLHHILGLDAQMHETIEVREQEAGVTIEFATHDLKKVISLLLKGNGNVLESLFSPQKVASSPAHVLLQRLAQGCITKRCAAHYKGMAYQQQRNLKNDEIKSLIHTYRCLLTGIHLMRFGQMELYLPTLAENYPLAQDLIARRGQRLSEHEKLHHSAFVEMLMNTLHQATEASPLPALPTQETRRELEQLLIHIRLGEK